MNEVVMGKSIRMIDSHCRIVMKNFDSVPQMQDRFIAHIRRNVATRFAKAISSSVAMRASRSWLQWTGPSTSGPEFRTPGVDCVGDFDRAMNRIELTRL